MRPMLVISNIEVQFRRFANVDRTVDIILRVHPDDATNEFVNEMRDRKNCRFLIEGFKQIPDDEQVTPTKGGSATSESNEAVGEATPASGGDRTQALSGEIESAVEIHNKEIAHKYLKICQARRRDPQFQGFLIDYFKSDMASVHDQDRRQAWVRNKQHSILGVESCALIFPGSHAEQMFKWLESAFLADQRNLPIPSMP